MMNPGYKGYEDPAIDWYEEHQIARLNPLEQQAQAWGRVYHLDGFARAENAEKHDKLAKAFDDIQEIADTLFFDEAEKVRMGIYDVMAEIEAALHRLEV